MPSSLCMELRDENLVQFSLLLLLKSLCLGTSLCKFDLLEQLLLERVLTRDSRVLLDLLPPAQTCLLRLLGLFLMVLLDLLYDLVLLPQGRAL